MGTSGVDKKTRLLESCSLDKGIEKLNYSVTVAADIIVINQLQHSKERPS